MNSLRKSPDAFRTISEVAEDLDLPQHVLRFWETRFSQIKPMKRGGGRRYYRPDDVDLLRGIRHLLYDEGYTIKGVQRILKEQGARHVIDTVNEDGAAGDVQASTGEQGEASPVHPANANAAEPNQLELQRPPLVMPQAPQTAAPQMARQEPTAPMQGTPAPGHPFVAPPQQHPYPVHHHPAEQPPASAQQMLSQAARKVEAGPTASAAYAYPAEPATDQQPQHQPQVQPQQQAPQPQVPPAAAPPQQSFVPHEQAAPAFAPSPQAPTPAPDLNGPAQNPPSPRGLREGDPKFLRGESASISVEDGRARLLEEEQRTGLFSRFRVRADSTQQGHAKTEDQGIARDDVRRLQSTLFELLECKRLLDQARND
ncbi:MerR HTH family regulatory protein [Cohaesibacter sp. ES.047]|nr:MerR HTH family regulatory protein [Cohaesibacter sp. ES.047]